MSNFWVSIVVPHPVPKLSQLFIGQEIDYRKMQKSEWQIIEQTLGNIESSELLRLIKKLYELNEDNKRFLRVRYIKSKKSEQTLNSYKKAIEDALYPDVIHTSDEVNFIKAWKIISEYKIAKGDDRELADLMIFYVETANNFTLNYGDMWEGFYEELEDMFDKVIKHILSMKQQNKEIADLQDRLKAIVISTQNIGWGYHDALHDMYFDAFDE
ncbi:MAG: hypothetical protein HQM14_21615 [SAR324 cluster bacterium]|nr:hypothetical protein [SAR324 cluster bacterium]